MLRTIRWLAVAVLALQVVGAWLQYAHLAPARYSYGPETTWLSIAQQLLPDLLTTVAFSSAFVIAVILLVAAAQTHRWGWFASVLVLTVLMVLEGIGLSLFVYEFYELPGQPPSGAAARALQLIYITVPVVLQALVPLAALAFSFLRPRMDPTSSESRGPDGTAAVVASAIAPAPDAAM